MVIGDAVTEFRITEVFAVVMRNVEEPDETRSTGPISFALSEPRIRGRGTAPAGRSERSRVDVAPSRR